MEKAIIAAAAIIGTAIVASSLIKANQNEKDWMVRNSNSRNAQRIIEKALNTVERMAE